MVWIKEAWGREKRGCGVALCKYGIFFFSVHDLQRWLLNINYFLNLIFYHFKGQKIKIGYLVR